MAAAIVATLLVLAASAPLGVHERNTREVSQEDILFNISVGLGVLRNSSVSSNIIGLYSYSYIYSYS